MPPTKTRSSRTSAKSANAPRLVLLSKFAALQVILKNGSGVIFTATPQEQHDIIAGHIGPTGPDAPQGFEANLDDDASLSFRYADVSLIRRLTMPIFEAMRTQTQQQNEQAEAQAAQQRAAAAGLQVVPPGARVVSAG